MRTGATVARALASYLDIPLVGVNHSVAHIEIGKLKTGAKDPVTLYVSGGNTMVTAYESGTIPRFRRNTRHRLGNCLDVFAREAGLKTSRRGCRLAQPSNSSQLKGEKLVSLPYVVKGMDLSLSGLLTAAYSSLQKGDCSLKIYVIAYKNMLSPWLLK